MWKWYFNNDSKTLFTCNNPYNISELFKFQYFKKCTVSRPLCFHNMKIFITLHFFISNLVFCLELGLILGPKLVLGLLKFFLCNLEVCLKKVKKIKKRSVFTCIKSLNWYNLRHNNWAIFSIFLYFKYSFLSKSFIYKFVHAIIFLFIERKAISCLSVELPRIYQYWSCLIIL